MSRGAEADGLATLGRSAAPTVNARAGAPKVSHPATAAVTVRRSADWAIPKARIACLTRVCPLSRGIDLIRVVEAAARASVLVSAGFGELRFERRGTNQRLDARLVDLVTLKVEEARAGRPFEQL